jgi:hypothetical protein
MENICIYGILGPGQKHMAQHQYPGSSPWISSPELALYFLSLLNYFVPGSYCMHDSVTGDIDYSAGKCE